MSIPHFFVYFTPLFVFDTPVDTNLSFNMRTQALLVAALAAGANAHGMIKSIEGANGVSMPGLSGTLRSLP